MRVDGNMLGLEINGEFVSCETSCEFNFEIDMRPASPIEAGRWKEVIPGVRAWGMSVNANLMLAAAGSNMDKILNAILTGEILHVRFKTRAALIPEFSISGKAYPLNGSIAAATNVNATWNLVLTGNGPFTYGAGQFNVGFGYTETDPTGVESTLIPQFFKDVGITSMDLDFSEESSGFYLFAKVPVALVTIFTHWYNNLFNYGLIPDFVWRDPIVDGDFRYYISRNPLYITGAEPLISFTS